MKNNYSRRSFIKDSGLLAGSMVASNSLFAGSLFKNEKVISNSEKDDNTHASTDNKSKNAADIIVERLIAWKVEFIFGLVGDGINPIFEALRKQQNKIKLITVRHEEAAAFMASGYAKYTGRLGVCIGTSGPGAVHLMNGLYDAAMEGAPVLALTGSPYHDLLGTNTTQEVNTVSLMKDVAVYNQMITGPRHSLTVVDLACRAALSTPGVAHLTISKDTQQKKLSDDSASKDSENLIGSAAFVPRIEIPSDNELNIAADMLNSAMKITILCGRGALQAGKEIEQLADRLGAPVAKALLGKAVIPDSSLYTTGGTGHLGTLPSKQMMQECDLLFIIGSTMPHLDYYPKPGNVKCIQLDRDPKRIGLRCAVDLGLNGDVKATINALLPKLSQHNHDFLSLAQQHTKDWKSKIAKVESNTSVPIKPQYLAAQASKLLNEDAAIAIDTGAHTVFTARHLQLKEKQQLIVSGNLATMAPGLPYAIAAQIAYPNRQCVAFVGDGGFTMLMAEMATAVRYDLPVKIIIFKNNALSMDKFEQEEMGGKDYGIELQPIDFVTVAKACGAEGYTCSNPNELPAVLKKAFASVKPCVISVDVDPNENPVPPDKV
ncbi:MAG TPA: thiamine pyrophosphate-dependent enzyme [Bacteroidia bacterium]|nr:thiamine pyrophosphate-dependent enzyme [Bacteroidia bacterium]